MKTRKVWLIATILFILVLLCAALVSLQRSLIPGFPEILLGQLALGGDTKPLSPRAYQSAEFVLNEVAPSEIEQAVFIALDKDVLFWEPDYVGFKRTILNQEEIRLLQQVLTTGNLFYPAPDGSSYQCVTQYRLKGPTLETCAQGEQYWDQYLNTQWEAEKNHTVGVLQFSLSDGRLAEIRVYSAAGGLAYTPYEKSGDWWLDGITASSPLIDELFARVSLPSISVLWPEMTASQANARAARTIGKRYMPALVTVQASASVQRVFGEIQEIRPAAGNNYSSSWMDSTGVFLTFRVIGSRGEGAVIVQGDNCYSLQMVFKGVPKDGGNSCAP